MAQLTADDYREIRKDFFRMGFGKEEFKALAGGMPPEPALLAGLQSLEDAMVANFASMKLGMDAAFGRTTTNVGCQKIMAAYLRWKIRDLLGV